MDNLQEIYGMHAYIRLGGGANVWTGRFNMVHRSRYKNMDLGCHYLIWCAV